VDESHADTWHVWLVVKGATWPNHGLPRGTPGFANMGYVKNFWCPGDRTRDLLHGNALTQASACQRATGGACYVNGALYVFKFVVFETAGGRAGA
jgi:hypothetical protein